MEGEDRVLIVIPCYNESARLNVPGYFQVLRRSNTHLLFVNDGSTDDTLSHLKKIENMAPDQISVLSLDKNRGKAEAVRRGMLRAIHDGAEIVGYIDADMATPSEEVLRLVKVCEKRDVSVVMGSRVATMGIDVQRHWLRHYLGRLFAYMAGFILKMRIYDTQCGAKFFRMSSLLKAALEEQFISRWAFDVELIGRLNVGMSYEKRLNKRRFLEVPLERWKDVAGSKVKFHHMIVTFSDMIRIWFDLKKRKRRGGAGIDLRKTGEVNG
ncbi:glycosyltransferase [Bdellovibrionota bacterium]